MQLLTSDPRLVLRELAGADAAEYYAVLDRNRLHLTRFGDYSAEAAQPWEPSCGTSLTPPTKACARYLVHRALAGRVDLNPVSPP